MGTRPPTPPSEVAVRTGAAALATGAGDVVRLGRRLASGGQGEVFEVLSPPGSVFKRIFDRALADDPSVEARLAAMLTNRPSGWQEPRTGHVMLSWPTDVVSEGGRFVGLLMPLIEIARTVELHEIANPSDRRSPSSGKPWTKGFTWRYLVATAENLALATETLHDAGVVIGDFNERNILVWSDSRVSLLDCDSMQVTDPGSGRQFLCRVGRPEFTAPELLGADWDTTVRAASSDLFALAVHLHQLLLEGDHPFDGVWHGSGEKPKRQVLARDGLWVHAGDARLTPRPSAVDVDLLPAGLRDLFRRAFVAGATNSRARPTAAEWHAELAELRASLIVCTKDANHYSTPSSSTCPWCDRAEAARARNALSKATAAALAPAPPRHTMPQPAVAPRRPRRSRARWLWAAVAVIVVAIVGATAAAQGRGGRDEAGSADPPAPSTTAVPTGNPGSNPADGSISTDGLRASAASPASPPPETPRRPSATAPVGNSPLGAPRPRAILVEGPDPRCPAGTYPIAEDHGGFAPNCANPAPSEPLPAESRDRFPRPTVRGVDSRGPCVGGLCPIRVQMEPPSRWDDGYGAPLFRLLEDGATTPNSVEDAGGSTWVSEGSRCFWIFVSYFPEPGVASGRIDPGFTNPVCLTIAGDGTITNVTLY